MPIAEFQTPDGKTAQFEVPDGTTPEQAQEMMTNYMAQNPQDFSQNIEQQPITPSGAGEKKGFLERGKEAVGEFFTGVEPTHQFDPNVVATSLATGAAIGGGLGALGFGAGALPGAAAGGVAGLVGGTAGELARTVGSSPAVAMGAELLAGGLSSVGRQAASILSKSFLNWHTKSAAKEMIKVGEEFGAPTMRQDVAEKAVKKRLLGEKAEDIPVTQVKNRAEVDKANIADLKAQNISVKPGQIPSDAMREHLYGQMTNLTKYGKPFAASPEVQQLERDMEGFVSELQMTPRQAGQVRQILRNQTSKNKDVAGRANEAIISLIQKGEVYAPDGSKQIINEPVRNALRLRFNEYLKSNTGHAGFDALKNIEKLQFQADALDAIPGMVRENFKDITSKEFKDTMKNIANSGAAGKNAFVNALRTHFYDKDPSDFMMEFSRLRKPIQESGVMDATRLDELRTTLNQIPKEITKERWKLLANRAMASFMYSEIGREMAKDRIESQQ